jgi:hypothetical protein
VEILYETDEVRKDRCLRDIQERLFNRSKQEFSNIMAYYEVDHPNAHD